jgi:hypothetical protein
MNSRAANDVEGMGRLKLIRRNSFGFAPLLAGVRFILLQSGADL